MCVVDQGALGPVTTQRPQPERARHTQSSGLDGTLGKTARIIDPKLVSCRSLARILSKGCKHGDRSNLVTLESTTLTHITHRQHIRGHLRQMAQEAIPLKLHTSHVNPMCTWRVGGTQSFEGPHSTLKSVSKTRTRMGA